MQSLTLVEGDKDLHAESLLKVSTNTLTNTQPRRIAHQLLSTPDGTLIEILASPEEVGDGICLLRGTVMDDRGYRSCRRCARERHMHGATPHRFQPLWFW